MSMRYRVKLEVNGAVVEIEVEARETLLDVLRHHLGLTGTHAGCEEGSCGACTVLLDGDVVRSCLVLAVRLEGRAVTTIEALGRPDDLHPVQQALQRHHGLQCGFCTPGIVLTAVELLARNSSPTEAEIRAALAGNLCRCTGYSGIVTAIAEVASSGRASSGGTTSRGATSGGATSGGATSGGASSGGASSGGARP